MKRTVFGALLSLYSFSACAQTASAGANKRSQILPSTSPDDSPKAGNNDPAADIALPATTEASAQPLDRFESLGIKGWDTPFPQVADTVLQDAGGIRSALADAGIGFLGFSANGGVYNFRHDQTAGASYNGKHPTYFFGVQALYLTFDTGELGLDNGQIQVQAGTDTNGLNQINGPRFARIGGLDYYQQLWNDTVEFKIGYFSMAPEFVGTQVAGSLVAGTLGPQAGIPVQLGFSYSGLAAPAADLRINGKDGVYAKFGVQRSFPRGGINEVVDRDKVGLRFSYPGAKALFIGEAGINRKSEPDRRSFWIRAGAIYNTTQFMNFRTGGTSKNWAVFFGGDKQITQPDSQKPFRGLYLGASFNYAPPDRNRYSQYYEGRIYGIGLLDGRPTDLASIVISYNKLSRRALAAQFPENDAEVYAFSAIASYSYSFVRGVYVQPGFGLVKNPIPAPSVPLSVNGYLTISFLL